MRQGQEKQEEYIVETGLEETGGVYSLDRASRNRRST